MGLRNQNKMDIIIIIIREKERKNFSLNLKVTD